MKNLILLFVIFQFLFSQDALTQKEWDKYAGNPILEPGPAGSWCEGGKDLGHVIFDGSMYHMWYGGNDFVHNRIGHATSTDGISWTEDPANPVLDIGIVGTWEESTVSLPTIILKDSEFHMWYVGAWGMTEQIGHATSPDGSTWTKDPANPVLENGSTGSWDDFQLFPMAGSAIYEDNMYKMWYGGCNTGFEWHVGYATSIDGSFWTKYAGNPIISSGSASEWDGWGVIPGTVIHEEDKYSMWYSGCTEDNRWRVGVASSVDGIGWTKYSCNPVLDYGFPGSWDYQQVWNASVLFDNGTNEYKMWYTGGPFATPNMGYATSQNSQIIRVPCDYTTIQEGIDAAVKGDTVLVDPGTYYENIKYKGKAITVASKFIISADTNYINNTIINGSQAQIPDSAAVVTFCNNEDSTSIICGFTITGGSGNLIFTPPIGAIRFGGGISCDHAGGKIIHNKIINNIISNDNASSGAGIGTSESGNNWCVIRYNTIKNNSSSATTVFACGGGIALNGKGIVDENVIDNNDVYCGEGFCYGGGLFVEAYTYSPADSVLILNNNLSGNTAEGYGQEVLGGAISVWYATSTISNNSITNNTVLGDGNICYGAGISMCKPYGISELHGNYIADNDIPGDVWHVGVGFHLWLPFDTVLIHENEFIYNTGNSALDGFGGGICLLDTKYEWVEIEKNSIYNNEARAGGGVFLRSAFNMSIVNNLFSGNHAYWGGGLYITQQSTATSLSFGIINNTFFENYAGDMGGGIRLNGDSGYDIVTYNNIFWENMAGNVGNSGAISNGSTANLFHIYYSDINENNIDGSWDGDYNIYDDPDFTDTICHISCGPCWEAGTPEIEIGGTTYYAPVDDIDGQLRPIWFNYDIGADESDCVGIPEFEPLNNLEITISPNPSIGEIRVRYKLENKIQVNLSVLNINGKLLQIITPTKQSQGEQNIQLNLSHLPDGIYFIRLQAGDQMETAKVILIK